MWRRGGEISGRYKAEHHTIGGGWWREVEGIKLSAAPGTTTYTLQPRDEGEGGWRS